MSRNPDMIIDRIDAGDLRPHAHNVVSALAAHLKLSPVGAEVMKAFKKGRSVGNTELLNRLWIEVESLPQDQQGGRRMLVSLLHPDAAIDWEHAEYLIKWAEDEGIPDATILGAFGVD